jgi:hypothetical protein
MNDVTRALVELRKDHADLIIKLLDNKAYVTALQETLCSLDHRARSHFEHRLNTALEQVAADKQEWQRIADVLKTTLEKFELPKGPIH